MTKDPRDERHAASNMSLVSGHFCFLLRKEMMAVMRFVKDWQGVISQVPPRVSLKENRTLSPVCQ